MIFSFMSVFCSKEAEVSEIKLFAPVKQTNSINMFLNDNSKKEWLNLSVAP